MGSRSEASCLDCGESFMVSEGGGFFFGFFHLLRCEECGDTKSIGFDELGELHLRYLKELPGPYSMVSAEHDRYVREHAPVEPISEQEYWAGVEAAAGSCECGGRFVFDASPGCPACRSTNIAEGTTTICYD